MLICPQKDADIKGLVFCEVLPKNYNKRNKKISLLSKKNFWFWNLYWGVELLTYILVRLKHVN